MENKYHNSKIYTIKNKLTNDIYVGSTTISLSQRMAKHRASMNCEKRGKCLLYQKMREHGVENFFITLIEKYSCNDVEELRAKEGEWIQKIGTLNLLVAGRTPEQYRKDTVEHKKEYDKDYRERTTEKRKEQAHQRYENNKEHIKQKSNQHYHQNKEEINQKQKIYRDNNQDKIRECKRNHRIEHKEEIREKAQQHYQKNKEEINAKHKIYRDAHKEELKEKRNMTCQCECGVSFTHSNKSRHLKSQHHQNFILNNNIDNVSQEEKQQTETTTSSRIN